MKILTKNNSLKSVTEQDIERCRLDAFVTWILGGGDCDNRL